MKVLQVNKFYHPDIGGVETVVRQYAESLSLEHEVTVLCIKKNFSFRTAKEQINGVSIIRMSSLGTFFSMPVSVSFLIRFLLIYKNFDVIHFHEPFPLGSLLSIFINKKTRVIITWHSDIIKQKSLKKIVEVFQRRLCHKALYISTTSPRLLDFSAVLSEFRSKVFILPLSISANKKISSVNGNYILYLGRLSYYKGIDILLSAYEIAKTDLELVIVGDGDKSIVEDIKEFSKNTKKRVRFINRYVSEEEKSVFLQNCTFFVLPSIEASEAFAIIQLEAMIVGKAVINTNLPTGVPYVSIDAETGLTVEPKDPEKLAKAIELLSSDSNLRNQLGKNGHNRVVNQFSDNVIIKNLKNKYSQM